MALSPHVSDRIDTVWKDWLEPDLREFTVQVAEDVLREEVARGFDAEPVVITDGRYRADYRNVKLFGKIEFAARQNVADAVRWIIAELYARSPYKGTQPYVYRSSFVVMVNGAAIDWKGLDNLRPGDKVQIVNTVPYARKIEGATASKKTGRKKRKPSSRQAPGGVFRPVVAIAKRRYGRVMFIDYKMIPLKHLGVKVWGQQGGVGSRSGKAMKARYAAGDRSMIARVQRDQVYPAIQISQGRAISGYN